MHKLIAMCTLGLQVCAVFPHLQLLNLFPSPAICHCSHECERGRASSAQATRPVTFPSFCVVVSRSPRMPRTAPLPSWPCTYGETFATFSLMEGEPSSHFPLSFMLCMPGISGLLRHRTEIERNFDQVAALFHLMDKMTSAADGASMRQPMLQLQALRRSWECAVVVNHRARLLHAYMYLPFAFAKRGVFRQRD
jgi:hypothetical protein